LAQGPSARACPLGGQHGPLLARPPLTAGGLGASLGAALAAWLLLRRSQAEDAAPGARQPAGAVGKRRRAAKAAGAPAAGGCADGAEPQESGGPPRPPPRREVLCADALEWLRPGVVPPRSIVLTGIPDVCEVQAFAPTMKAWEAWFLLATRRVLEALPPRGVAVFVQTDIRGAGVGQVSKLGLLLRAAADVEGARLLWHKVAHFGTVDKGCQGGVKFSHLACFMRAPAEGPEAPAAGPEEPTCGLPDVLWRGLKPRGLKNSERCFGVHMTRSVLLWASKQLGAETVVDPFCGAGTVLAVGNALGMHAVGVDISPRRVKQAGRLDGEALLTYEHDVLAKVSQLQGGSGELVGHGVRLSGRARKQAKGSFKATSAKLLQARS